MTGAEGAEAPVCALDADAETVPEVSAAGAIEELREQYEARTADEHHEDNARSAARDFASCRLVERGDGRWLLAMFDADGVRRGGRVCEVAVLRVGLVVIHGLGCAFAAFRVGLLDGGPRAAVDFIGRRRAVDSEVADALALAMGRGLERRLDADVFRHEAIDYLLGDRCGNGPPEATDVPQAVEFLESAFDELDDGAGDEGVVNAQRSLHSDLQDDEPEYLFALGRVYERRVYEGHAALARLSALLADEDAARAADCSTVEGRVRRLLSAVRGPGHSVQTWSAPGSARAWVEGPDGVAHEEGAGEDEAEAMAALVADLGMSAVARIGRGAGGLGTAMREALEEVYLATRKAAAR